MVYGEKVVIDNSDYEKGFTMQRFLALSGLALALSATMSVAGTPPKKPVSQWTCEEFLTLDDQFKPNAIYFSEGLNKKHQPVDAVMDETGALKVTPMVVTECQKDRKASFWSKLKTTWQNIEQKM